MKKIVIITGDPNSINSELIYKSLKKIKKSIKSKIYLISNYNLLKNQLKKLKYKLKLCEVKSLEEKGKKGEIKLLNIELKYKNPFKVNKLNASNYVLESLDLGHALALKNKDVGLINCPISKELLKKDKIGVTEYLSSKSKIKVGSEAMLISNNKLAVCPITTHIDIKDVSRKIKKKIIINKIITINKWFQTKYKKKIKVGVLGLNPHNAELRKNSEEIKNIIPAINSLKKKGVSVDGPLVADTVFIKDYKKYHVLVGMFHDQVLTPFKTLFKFDAVNITLGLKYIRVSPDHGIAKNLIFKKKANPESLIKCINLINKFK